MTEPRDFKGIWIEKSIWLDKRLNALEKVVLAEIDSLDGEDGCYCSNKYLADFCQCSERKITDAINKLVKFDYIEIESFDGRRRVLRSRVEKFARQTGIFCESEQGVHYNINNKTTNTDIKANNAIAEQMVDEMFERLWKLYPRKEGKRKVSKKSKEAIYAAGEAVVEKAIKNYTAYIARRGWGEDYTKQGSTFFNGDWQDYVVDEEPPEPNDRERESY